VPEVLKVKDSPHVSQLMPEFRLNREVAIHFIRHGPSQVKNVEMRQIVPL
jgi:hypothetical protein